MNDKTVIKTVLEQMNDHKNVRHQQQTLQHYTTHKKPKHTFSLKPHQKQRRN